MDGFVQDSDTAAALMPQCSFLLHPVVVVTLLWVLRVWKKHSTSSRLLMIQLSHELEELITIISICSSSSFTLHLSWDDKLVRKPLERSIKTNLSIFIMEASIFNKKERPGRKISIRVIFCLVQQVQHQLLNFQHGQTTSSQRGETFDVMVYY